MNVIRTQGRIFVSALPQESVTANIARRVLKLIREEYDTLQAVGFSCEIPHENRANIFTLYRFFRRKLARTI